MDARRLQELDGHSVEAESNFEILRAQRAQVQRGVKLANGEGLGVRRIEDLLVEGWDVRVVEGPRFFRLMNDSGMISKCHGVSEEVSMVWKAAGAPTSWGTTWSLNLR